MSAGRQHRDLKGEKRNEKADVVPKQARNLRLDRRVCEQVPKEIRAVCPSFANVAIWSGGDEVERIPFEITLEVNSPATRRDPW